MNTQTIILRKTDTEMNNFIDMVRKAHEKGVNTFAIDVDANQNILYTATVGYARAVFIDLHPTSNSAIEADKVISGTLENSANDIYIRMSGQTYRDALINDFVNRLHANYEKSYKRFVICSSGKSFFNPRSSTKHLLNQLERAFPSKTWISPIINCADATEVVVDKLKYVQGLMRNNKVVISLAAFGTEMSIVRVSDFSALADVAFTSLAAWTQIEKIGPPREYVKKELRQTEVTKPNSIVGEIIIPLWVKEKPDVHASNIRRLYPPQKITILEIISPQTGVKYAKLDSGEWIILSDQGIDNVKILE